MDQLDLINIYRTFHTKAMNFTFFLKCTQNLAQDRSHPGPEIKPWQIHKTCNHLKHLF